MEDVKFGVLYRNHIEMTYSKSYSIFFELNDGRILDICTPSISGMISTYIFTKQGISDITEAGKRVKSNKISKLFYKDCYKEEDEYLLVYDKDDIVAYEKIMKYYEEHKDELKNQLRNRV